MNNIDLDFKREQNNFIDYHNREALFNTKSVDNENHNGEVVKVLGLLKGKDKYCDKYIILFNDGTIRNDIYYTELNFNNIKEKLNNKKSRRNDNGS